MNLGFCASKHIHGSNQLCRERNFFKLPSIVTWDASGDGNLGTGDGPAKADFGVKISGDGKSGNRKPKNGRPMLLCCPVMNP